MAVSLSAQDRVIELLRTLADARTDWDGRADGNGVLLMPSPYNEGSYRELEDRLAELREARRPLWWHVCYRYRFGEQRVIVASVVRRKSGASFALPPRTELVAGGPSVGSKHAICRVYQWSDRVNPDLVTEGVDVLTYSMHGGREDRIWLPLAVYDRMMGRLLKVAA